MNKLFLLCLVSLSIPQNLFAQKNLKFSLNFNKAYTSHYTPDQTLLAIAVDNEVHFYTAGTTTFVKMIRPDKGQITAFSFHEDGKHIVSSSLSDRVVLWDYTMNMFVKSWSVNNLITASLTADLKVAAITDDSLMLYDFDTQKVLFKNKAHSKPIRSLAVSENGTLIATGGGDGFVIIQQADGAILSNKRVHDSWVRALTFSPDGNLIASGDDKGNVAINDLQGNLIFESHESKGWVTSLQFSGDGKYLAVGDEKGNCLVYWIERITVSHRLDHRNSVLAITFKPDGKELSIIDWMVGVKVWDVSNLTIAPVFKYKDKKDNTPPQILVSNPPNTQSERLRFSKDLIVIKGTVVDESGVRNLKINGVTIPLKENGNFVLYLPLTMGDNFVTIEARDINENIAVKKFVITRKDLTGEEYDVAKAKNYLFVVGINDYAYWPKLNNAVKDASDITTTLLGLYNFDFSNVILLKNEQSTRNNIYKSLRSLIELITPQDNLLIYYSGHGFFDELLNEGYWIPVDAQVNAAGDYLSNSDLLKIIGNINSQHTFLVADACFSGSLFSDSKRGYTENVEKYKSRWGLASGRLEVVSDGEIGQNSPFTETVLEFLKDNGKEKFPVSDLIYYVKTKVAERSNQTPLGNPLKSAGDEGGEFVFYKKQ
jgi:WD40 repeat protein